ncbi:MAG: Diacylglycerol kinase, partial [Candidatus Dependentiae bacterium]|nr:Diacylglycerol kinase [Candidatus Dependentiae bacterium]
EPEPVVYRAPSPVGSVPDDEPDVVQSRISSPIASLHLEASRREEAPFEFEETDNPDEVTDDELGGPVLSLKDQLIEAVKNNDTREMRSLKSQNPGVDFSAIKIGEEYQESLLRRAIQYGHRDMVQWLIEEAQFDKDAPTDAANGDTPLGAAAWYGQTEIVRYLLSVGANPQVRNITKQTPFGLAKNNPGHCDEIRNLLEPPLFLADLPRSPTPESLVVVEEVRSETPVCAGAGCDSEEEGAEEELSCSTCCHPFEAGETLAFTPCCRNIFHDNCCKTWLSKGGSTCPGCGTRGFSSCLLKTGCLLCHRDLRADAGLVYTPCCHTPLHKTCSDGLAPENESISCPNCRRSGFARKSLKELLRGTGSSATSTGSASPQPVAMPVARSGVTTHGSVGPAAASGLSSAASVPTPFDYDLYVAKRLVEQPWLGYPIPLATFKSTIGWLGRNGCPLMKFTYSDKMSYSLPFSIDKQAAECIDFWIQEHPDGALFQLRVRCGLSFLDSALQFGWCYVFGSGEYLVHFSHDFGNNPTVEISGVFGSDDLQLEGFQRILDDGIDLPQYL